jgi:hypothetical protein
VRQSGAKTLKDVAHGCSVTREPDHHCDEQRKITRFLPSTTGLWAPYTHRDCTCNEFVALRNRVIGAVPEPTKSGLRKLEVETRILSRQLPRTPQMTYDAFVEHYTGMRRKRYRQAADSLILNSLDLSRESGIKAFVKAEKFGPGKVNPDPRMIQARSPRYNTELGRYLKPMEHHLYRLTSERTGQPLLGKGLSMQDRGKVLHNIWSSFRKPVCVSLDGSRWDQHVHADVLRLEHDIYKRCNSDPMLADLLERQINNKCATARGYRYKCYGRRMSGDMNTALGNCVLMIAMCRAFIRQLGIVAEIFDDGDDVLLITERQHLPEIKRLAGPCFLEFGQEIKVENISFDIESIEWCQGHPVMGTDGQYQMVANWRKILSQSSAGIRYWHEDRTRYDMAFSVGQCLIAMYPGIPIISKYAERLCSRGKLNRDVFEIDWIHKVKAAGLSGELGKLEVVPPTPEVRRSFALAFGVDEVDQLQIEAELDDFEIGVGLVDGPVEVSGEWRWEHHPQSDPRVWEWPTHPPPKH